MRNCLCPNFRVARDRKENQLPKMFAGKRGGEMNDKCRCCPVNCTKNLNCYLGESDCGLDENEVLLLGDLIAVMNNGNFTPADMDAIRKAIAGEGRLVCTRQEEYETGVWLSGLMQTNLHQQERGG